MDKFHVLLMIYLSSAPSIWQLLANAMAKGLPEPDPHGSTFLADMHIQYHVNICYAFAIFIANSFTLVRGTITPNTLLNGSNDNVTCVNEANCTVPYSHSTFKIGCVYSAGTGNRKIILIVPVMHWTCSDQTWPDVEASNGNPQVVLDEFVYK